MKMTTGGVNTVSMTTGSSFRHMICFALPLMIGNAFQQVYTLTDTAVVGQVLGMAALSALGACDLLIWTISSAIQAYTEGFSIKMAARFGADDSDGFHRTVVSGAYLSAGAAVILLLAMQLTIPGILSLMHVRTEVYPYALMYLRIICAGIPFVTTYNFCFAILRALGNSKIPLRAMSISAALNILLDILFVAVLKCGIGSAALATVISQLFSAVYSLVVVSKLLRKAFAQAGYDRTMAGKMLKLSVPMAGQIVISSIGGLVVQSVVNSNDVAFIAGYTATYKLYGLLEVASIAYGFAVTTYTGQNYGAGQYARIRRGLWTSECIAIVTALVFTAAIYLFGQPVISLFVSGTEEEIAVAVSVGLRFLKIMGIGLPTLYTVHVLRSFVQGLGHAMYATLNSMVELIARIAVVTWCPAFLGAECVFFAEPAAWTAGAVFLALGSLVFLRKTRKDDLSYL